MPSQGWSTASDRDGNTKTQPFCLNPGLLYRPVSALEIPVGWLSLCCVCSGQLPLLPNPTLLTSLQVYHLRPLHNKPAHSSTLQSLFPGPKHRQLCALSNTAPNENSNKDEVKINRKSSGVFYCAPMSYACPLWR